MKKTLSVIAATVIFLAGLSLLLYPLIANQWNTYRQNKITSDYEETVSRLEEAGVVDYEEQWAMAQSYNSRLEPYVLPDSFAMAEIPEEGKEEYRNALNLTGDGMMGYVEIPKIGIRLPIYHTTSEEVLQKAAGHLAGSSLPVGGEGTHAVISAHRGLPSAAMFTDLDQLAQGDYFQLHILNDILRYQVDQILVVEPDETEALQAVEGMDLVTLLTCTPYGVNSQRLLVRGHRVPYEEMEEEETPLGLLIGPSLHTSYLLWVLIGLAVTVGFILLMYVLDRRWKRKKKGQE